MNDDNTSSKYFNYTMGQNTNKAKMHTLKDSLANSVICELSNHNIISKLKKIEKDKNIHTIFLNLAEKFLKSNDIQKLNKIFLKEEIVYKKEQEDDETMKKYRVKSKKMIVTERIRTQINEISKFDIECEEMKYCEWSGNNIFPNTLKVDIDTKYNYIMLIDKLEDFKIPIWHENM